MMDLSNLKNTTLKRKKRRRVGRGLGSGLGKTCGRGEKGAGARSGYKRRLGYEGGQMRLFMKMPIRGFSNKRFQRLLHTIKLSDIETAFEDGDNVTIETLAEKGFIRGRTYGVKLLGNGSLTKKVSIEVDAITEGAREKLQKAKIDFKILG